MKSDLHRPEKDILNLIGKDTVMLDLGVGAGRTTFNLQPLVKEYIGVDYSKSMTDLCKERFPGVKFETKDAKDLDFPDGHFDFILFSFNGLDYVSHEDRVKTLQNIRRMLKKGGLFVFSSHNINRLHSITWSRNPFRVAYRLYKMAHILLLNGFPHGKYSIVNDGAHGFKLKTYYIDPKEQLKQLESAGFECTKTLGVMGQEEVTANDAWVTYYCK